MTSLPENRSLAQPTLLLKNPSTGAAISSALSRVASLENLTSHMHAPAIAATNACSHTPGHEAIGPKCGLIMHTTRRESGMVYLLPLGHARLVPTMHDGQA